MDRREWLGLVGAGVGVSLEGSALQADEQGHAKTEDRSLMAPVHELAIDRVRRRLPGLFLRADL